MPTKKIKPLKKDKKGWTLKNVDNIYREFKNEIFKEKRTKMVGRIKTDKKNVMKIKEHNKLEDKRRNFLIKLEKELFLDITLDDKPEKFRELLFRELDLYYDETKDTDMKIIITTLSQDIYLLRLTVDGYISKVYDKTGSVSDTVSYLKNKFIEDFPCALENKYEENVGKEIDNLGVDMTKNIRDEFLKELRDIGYDEKEYSNVLNKYKSKDEFMANLVGKFNLSEIKDIAIRYFEYKKNKEDLDPAEFLGNQYNILKGMDEEVELNAENANIYKKLLKKIEKEEYESDKEDETEDDGETPEFIPVKSRKPVKDIEVIITPEMRDQLRSLYSFIDPYRRSPSENLKGDVKIIGVDKRCLDFQIYKPWLYKFSSTWINSNDASMLQKYSYPPYQVAPITVGGTEYRHSNKLFHILQCNSYSKNKTQKGYILTLYEDIKTPIEFKIAHLLTNNTILLQDEDIFKKEKEYIAKRTAILKSEEILNTKISEKYNEIEIAKRIVTNTLNRELKRIVEKYSLQTRPDELEKYVDKIVGSIYNRNKSKTIRDFLQDIANILLYLDNRMVGKYSEIFQKKLGNMFYKPEILSDLRREDRFEELYKNPTYRRELKTLVSQRIQYYNGIIVEEISRKIIYNLLGRPTRQREFEKLVDPLELDLEEIKLKCKNKDIIDSKNGEYLVYTEKSTGDMYCIPLYNVGDKNPYTEKPYPMSVIRELESLDKNIVRSYFDEMLFGEDYDIPAPDLRKILIREIKRMENNLTERNLPIKNVCGYCKKHINGESLLKTVVKHDSGSKIVNFCKIKCFEDWDVKSKK